VDVIGLSMLSGAHLPITEKLMARLKQAGLEDKLVLVGGNIPGQDFPALEALGADGIFPTGSSFDDIAAFIRDRLGEE
jgi:methylmalonyl-CoA mutase C-terminal domain/subunit